MNKVACGVVLYHPQIDKTISDIDRYSSIFDEVVLFDNTGIENVKIKDKACSMSNVRYISEFDNMGLPYAYNKIISTLNGYDFLCALDQDSLYKDKEIRSMMNAIEKFPKDAAVVGPHVIYDSAIDFTKSKKFIRKRYVITSGCFINLNYMRDCKISFDEQYFIDKFEVDLDMQFRRKGYSIYEYEDACLYQKLGTVGKNGKTNHSPLRHYYLFRNRFYFNHKYFKAPQRIIINTLQTIKHIAQIILFEESKLAKLKEFPIATADYLNGRTGKHVH